jgi:hypothetical protein
MATSNAMRRAVLPDPGEAIAAPSDRPSDELTLLSEGVLTLGVLTLPVCLPELWVEVFPSVFPAFGRTVAFELVVVVWRVFL